MKRLKNILRLMTVLVIVLVVGASPYLQARQLSDLGEDCAKSCCFGCCCQQNESSAGDTLVLKSSCCCSVSVPDTETEAPLQPQVIATINQDLFSPVISATSAITFVETRPCQTSQTCVPLAHGPPLYVLNATFLS